MKKADSTFVRAVAKKLKCIRLKGGKCQICGFDLIAKPWLGHFHHRDPSQKKLGIMVTLSSSLQLAHIEEELEKCDLLCGHCHADTHFCHEKFERLREKITECEQGLSFDYCRPGKEDIEKIRQLGDKGYSLGEIAKQVGFCVPTVSKLARPDQKFGNDRVRKITDEELVGLRERKVSLREIAIQYGMSYKTVWKRSKRLDDPNYRYNSC